MANLESSGADLAEADLNGSLIELFWLKPTNIYLAKDLPFSV
ncbi:MAG: hypothetical protein WBL88_02415 [Nitrososphaeraceae archaeon]